jgi:nucleoid DNA-binding protein
MIVQNSGREPSEAFLKSRENRLPWTDRIPLERESGRYRAEDPTNHEQLERQCSNQPKVPIEDFIASFLEQPSVRRILADRINPSLRDTSQGALIVQAREALDSFQSALVTGLSERCAVTLKRFGSFQLREHSRTYADMNSADGSSVRPKRDFRVVFSPAQELQQKLYTKEQQAVLDAAGLTVKVSGLPHKLKLGNEKPLNRRELCRVFAEEFGVSERSSSFLVGGILNTIGDSLGDNRQASFKGHLGIFRVRPRMGRDYIHPKTKEVVSYPSRLVVAYKPTEAMYQRIESGLRQKSLVDQLEKESAPKEG